jgi:hypothetical protein
MTAADLVIRELADNEAELLERLAVLTDTDDTLQRQHAWTCETLRVAVAMLARVTYERDRALAGLYQRAGVPTVAADDAVVA